MRFLVPLCVFLAVSAFHSALSASLESAEKEEVVDPKDGLGELQKIDQMKFEATQKDEAAQMNVTEEQNEEARYLEAVTDESVEEPVGTVDAKTAEGGGNSDVAAHEEHHEVVPETKSILDEASQDSTKKEQDVLE
nr:uncharacterized protein LOC117455739 isoform X5 [Pseudochaenichthys georgianus]